MQQNQKATKQTKQQKANEATKSKQSNKKQTKQQSNKKQALLRNAPENQLKAKSFPETKYVTGTKRKAGPNILLSRCSKV